MYKTAFVILFIVITGCINPFAPKLDESEDTFGSIISDQNSVEGVFTNLKYAYTFKDTLIYGKLLASDFNFVYRDYDINADVSWGREEEMKVTYGLFQNAQQLDLNWNNIIAMSSDSTNIIRSFNLTVTFNPTDIIFVNGRVNLTLAKNSGVWKINKWIDESNF